MTMRSAVAVMAGATYAASLAIAAISITFAIAIGPVDSFAIGMIGVPGAVALAAALVLLWLGWAHHRGLAAAVLALGSALAGATAWIVAVLAGAFDS